MALPNNYKKYPDNVYAPQNVEIGDCDYTVHKFYFRGLQDFYEFLKKNPDINFHAFNKNDISSVTNDFDFAGVSYDDALEKLVEDMDPGYQEYLQVERNIRAKGGYSHKYRPIKSVAGGNVDPVLYTVGSPTIYRSSRLIKKPKFITIDTQVAYYWGTSKRQVFNRALIITNLIKALEKNGYNIDVNSFMVAQKSDEVIQAIWEIKKHGQKMNYQTLYKSLVDVEFFRRLGFRVMEVSDVTNYWADGYGQTCGESFVRDLLKLKKDDIYFDQPSNMDIHGRDIAQDFQNAIECLGLEDTIDVQREKEILKESVKVLKR